MDKGALIVVCSIALCSLLHGQVYYEEDYCPIVDKVECEDDEELWYYDNSSVAPRYRPFLMYVEDDKRTPTAGPVQRLESDWQDELWPTPSNTEQD